MVKRKSKKKKGKLLQKDKGKITLLVVLIVVLIFVVAITPIFTSYLYDYQKTGHWDTIKETEYFTGNNTGDIIPPADAEGLNPNYELNTTYDKVYEITDGSYIDYPTETGHVSTYLEVTTPETQFGEPYYIDMGHPYWGADNMLLVVTDLNGTPIPDIPLLISAYAEDTAPWLINFFIGDRITLFNNDIVYCNDGTFNNELRFGLFGGWAEDVGWYHKKVLQISLPEDLLGYYADFVSTDSFIVYGQAIIYVRLATVDNKLIEIRDEINNSSDYLNMKDADNTLIGDLDGNVYGTNDAFIGIDVSGTDVAYYQPQVSKYNNDVYYCEFTHMIRVKSGISNVNIGTLDVRYEIWDINDIEIMPETYGMVYSVVQLDNATLPDYTDGEYINMITYFTLANNYIGYKFIVYYYYKTTGLQENLEKLGKYYVDFDDERYIYSYKYKYNKYFDDDNQTIHRQVYNVNSKLNMIVDYNCPMYLFEGETNTIRIRYMLISNNMTYHPYGATFEFTLYLEIIDEGVTYLHDQDDLQITYNAIGYKEFDFNVNSLGLEPLTSYGMLIYLQSNEPDGGNFRYAPLYTRALYYTLENYNDFLSDVKDLDDLIDSLVYKEDVGEGTYERVSDILEILKTKIGDVEDELDFLNGLYPDRNVDAVNDVRDSISYCRDYIIRVSVFMDKYSSDEVRNDNNLFIDFKSELSSLKFWYADAYTQFNRYVAYLNGENQIGDDVGNITEGYREYYYKKWVSDANDDLLDFIPLVVFLLSLLIAFICSLIVYFAFRNKIKNKYLLYTIVIIMFVIIAIIFYSILDVYNTELLFWYYGVG